MRLRNQMAASNNERQLKYLVYMLEQTTKLAEKTGVQRCQLSPVELHTYICYFMSRPQLVSTLHYNL